MTTRKHYYMIGNIIMIVLVSFTLGLALGLAVENPTHDMPTISQSK